MADSNLYTVKATGPLFQQADTATLFDREIVSTMNELGAMGVRLVTEREPAGVSSGGGGIRGSIFTELRGTPARREQRVASSVFYADIPERGRLPGRMPPTQAGSALRLWVQRKLGITGSQLPGVAFLVARKIGRVGYRGYFAFQRAFAQLEPIAQQKFTDCAGRIAAKLGGS